MSEHDHTQSLEIAARLRDAVQSLHDMAESVGTARQVKEFAAERRKNLLARYIAKTLSNIPMSTREVIARNDSDYLKEFEEQAEQSKNAEQAIAKFQAEQCRYEAARSLLSFSRIAFDVLQG